MTAFIYVLTNRNNGKCYVGQTTLTIDERWKYHLKSVKYGSDLHIHSSIRKYGQTAFEVSQLEECNERDLDDREIFWIEEIGTFGSGGYNETKGGRYGIRGYRPSPEKIERNRVTHTGKVYDAQVCALKSASMRASSLVRRVQVEQLDDQGNVIAIHASASMGAAMVGKPTYVTLVSRACRTPRLRFAGFYWRYTDGVTERKKRSVLITNECKPVMQVRGDGTITYHKSIDEAARTVGGQRGSIRLCCQGKRATAYGSKWSFAPMSANDVGLITEQKTS